MANAEKLHVSTDTAESVWTRRLPSPSSPDIGRTSYPRPLWSLLQVALGLAVLWGVLWGASLLALRWHGPTLQGARAVAGVAARRVDNPVVQALLAALDAGEIYTFDELQAAADMIGQIDQDADLALLTDLFFGLLVGAGLLLLSREVTRAFTRGHAAIPVASPVGVMDNSGTFVPRPLPAPQFRRIPPKALRRLPLMQGITLLTPLSSVILEIYAGLPEWPAASEGQHGNVTLLAHALGVRARALVAAEGDAIPPALAELVALGHDLGKLVTVPAPLEDYGTLTGDAGRLSPHHSRMSVLILSTLPEWQALPQEDRDDLTLAIAFHHRPDDIPVNAGLRARALLRLLRHADGLTTMRETREADNCGEAPSSTPQGDGRTPQDGSVKPPVESTKSGAPATGTSPTMTILTLEGRVAQALEQLVPILRINTRPFDGRADPDIGILMLLDRALRRALGPQLSPADQQALQLTPEAQRYTPDPNAESFPHPATPTIASALRTLSWLIEEHDSQHGILWKTRIGRLSWNDSWLLRLDAMPHALRERWGRSVWPIEIPGPTWPVAVHTETPLEERGDLPDNTAINNQSNQLVPLDAASHDMNPMPPQPQADATA